MKKYLLALFLSLAPSLMWADSKLTSLTQDTTAQATDLIYKVDNTSGTPVSRSITLGNLFSQIAVSSFPATGVTSGSYGSATQVPGYTVGADGRLTAASNTTISLTNSNLQVGSYPNLLVSSFNATGVTPGSYTNTNLTVDAYGRLSSASNGSAGGSSVYNATATAGFPYGLSSSTITVGGATALGILSGADRAKVRIEGILSLQNSNSYAPDSSGVFIAASSTGTAPVFMTVRRSSGTVAIATATGAGMNLLQIGAGGYGSTNWAAASTGRINFIAEEAFTDSSQPTAIQFGTTPSGSITTVPRVAIAANGSTTFMSSVTMQIPLASPQISTNVITGSVGCSFDPGSAVVGSTIVVSVPSTAIISSWAVVCPVSASISVSVVKSPPGPISFSSMSSGGNAPSLTSSTWNSAAPSSWTSTSIAANTIVGFVLNSISGTSGVPINVSLTVTKQ